MNDISEFMEIERATRYLLLDGGNFLWRNRFSNRGLHGTPEELNAFAIHQALFSFKKHFDQFQPDKVVIAFDSKPYWRLDILEMYKARREEQHKKDQGIDEFRKMVEEFAALIRDHSSVITLRYPTIEADDLIARWVQLHPGDEHIIVSNDKDYYQLQKHSGVKQWNPINARAGWCDVDDPKWALFEKCIRGESGASSDNIPSAFPKVRTTRLQKAFGDSYEWNQLMKEKVKDPLQGDKLVEVKELYERNKSLVDLEAQPLDIIEKMDFHIAEVKKTPGEFQLFYFLQYLGRRKLMKVADHVDEFIPLLTS